MKTIKFILTRNVKLPTRGTPESAGLDLYLPEDCEIMPGAMERVKMGLYMRLPRGTYGRLALRSSTAIMSIDLMAGVLDRDYQGEIEVMLINRGSQVVKFKRGERIVQMICEKYCSANPVQCYEFDKKTNRGTEGFGSTGK